MTDNPFSLSSTQRSTLFESQRISSVRDESANRLATGRRVNSISDEPRDFLRAQALANRVAGLGEIKGDISIAQNSIQATSVGLDAVESFSRQLRGIALAAGSAGSDAERAAFAEQFNEVRNQIDNLVNDTSFLGVNQLNTAPSTLTTRVGDSDGSTLSSEGSDTTVAGLGIGDAVSDFNGFASLDDVNAAIASVEGAVSQVRSTQADFTTDLAVLGVRDNFNDELSATLQTGADQLVNADLNEEAARQLSASVRGDLALQGQRILANGDSLILNLF